MPIILFFLISMKIQQNIACQICFPTNQTNSHLGILILKLQSILLNKKKQSASKQNVLIHNTSFNQLLDYVFKQYNQQPGSKKCSHEELKKFYMKRLAIEWQELIVLSQSIYQEIIKKKYELQVINQISKNLFKTAQQKSQKNKSYNSNEIDQQLLLQDKNDTKKHKKNQIQQRNENLLKNDSKKGNQVLVTGQVQIKTQNNDKVSLKVQQEEKHFQNQQFFAKNYQFQQQNPQYLNQKYSNQFNMFNNMSHQQQNQTSFPFYYVPNRNFQFYGNQNYNNNPYQFNYPMMQMPNYQNYSHSYSSQSSSSSSEQC